VTDDPESTIRGAAFLAGEAAGVVTRKEFQFSPFRETFSPRIRKAEREEVYRRWQRTLAAARAWNREEE
jgi:glycerol kinase